MFWCHYPLFLQIFFVFSFPCGIPITCMLDQHFPLQVFGCSILVSPPPHGGSLWGIVIDLPSVFSFLRQAWRHYSPVTVHFQISIRFLQPISAPLTQLTCPLCISFRAFNTLITQLNSVSGSPTAVSFLSPVPDCFVCWLGGWGGVLFLHLSMACFVLPKARYFVQDSRNWSKWI